MKSSVRNTILVLIVSTLCTEICARVAPDFIEICAGLKPDCLKENIQKTIPHFVKGVPSLGLNATDPLSLDYLKYDLPGGLKIEFFDGIVTGPRKCVVDSAEYSNNALDLKMHCDILIKGKYKADGKILLFTLNGEGDAKVRAKNLVIDCKALFEDKIRDGIEYYEAKNIKTNYRFEDRVSFDFTNLFKGNPELSQTILDFLNENWKQVLDEFANPLIEPILNKVLDIVKKFFKAVPKNEIIA